MLVHFSVYHGECSRSAHTELPLWFYSCIEFLCVVAPSFLLMLNIKVISSLCYYQQRYSEKPCTYVISCMCKERYIPKKRKCWKIFARYCQIFLHKIHANLPPPPPGHLQFRACAPGRNWDDSAPEGKGCSFLPELFLSTCIIRNHQIQTGHLVSLPSSGLWTRQELKVGPYPPLYLQCLVQSRW